MDSESADLYYVLAAHLFYSSLKAVPSLVRNWWLECKDRQLSRAVASISNHCFSSLLISDELAQLRSDSATKELQGDGFRFKIASSSTEVTAIYSIDEQDMEIVLKFPPEYPLHGMEVKEVRRVGVTEDKWRSWLLAVQQTCQVCIHCLSVTLNDHFATQNGMVFDALTLFKRNASLHFEGKVDCAICYS